MAGLDRTTALFASVPGGAAEMAVLGERFGARVDRVAAAQSLRILIVVAGHPGGLHAARRARRRPVRARGEVVRLRTGFVLLMAATAVGGFVFHTFPRSQRVRAGLAGGGHPADRGADRSLRDAAVGVERRDKCLLGCALGSRFQRDFLQGAHRFVSAVVISVLVAMALSAAFGAAWRRRRGLHPAHACVLGTAPGGIAEMCITAKVLQLGVPLVTAFHVARVVVILAHHRARLCARVQRWWAAGEAGSEGESEEGD